MIDLVKENAVWICTIIMAICAVLTLIHGYCHKNKKHEGQNISNVTNSNVNQAGGDINNAEQGKQPKSDGDQ